MLAVETERRGGLPLGRILIVVVLVALAVRTIDVLLVLFLAIILAVYLDATAAFLERRLGVPPTLGLLTGVLLSLGALAGTIFLIVPAVADQVTDLLTNLPQFLADLDRNINGLIRRVPVLGRRAGGSAQPGLLATSLGEVFGFLRGAAVPYLKGGVTFLIEAISVVVMAVYLARHPAVYTEGVVALVPPRQRELARSVLRDLNITFRAWIVGQLVAMVLLAVLTTIGLWLLGMPYFLAFGIFAGVAAIVPFFGTLLSTLLPALLALGSLGLAKAVAVAALGVGVHLIEANFVAPYVMERQVNLPPVITIAGVLMIGTLFGLVGLVIAVPILAFVMVLTRHILIGHVYGDPITETKPSGTIPAGAEPTIAPAPVTP